MSHSKKQRLLLTEQGETHDLQTPLASSQLRRRVPQTQQLLVRVPTLPQDHHHTTEGEDMTREEALAVIKLLSALESWAMSQSTPRLPEYLHEDLCKSMGVLERIVLKEKP